MDAKRDQISVVLLNKAMFAVDTVAEVTEEVVAALTAKDLVSGRRHIGTTMEVEDNDGGSYFVASFHGDTNAASLPPSCPVRKPRLPRLACLFTLQRHIVSTPRHDQPPEAAQESTQPTANTQSPDGTLQDPCSQDVA